MTAPRVEELEEGVVTAAQRMRDRIEDLEHEVYELRNRIRELEEGRKD